VIILENRLGIKKNHTKSLQLKSQNQQKLLVTIIESNNTNSMADKMSSNYINNY
jgi:hypothetical protein